MNILSPKYDSFDNSNRDIGNNSLPNEYDNSSVIMNYDSDTIDGDSDDGIYLSQLRDVFDSCDTNHNGSLNQSEMKCLCDKLKLCPNEQRLTLAELNLDSDTLSSTASFDQFKDAFLSVLTDTQEIDDEIGGEIDDEIDASSPALISCASMMNASVDSPPARGTSEASLQRLDDRSAVTTSEDSSLLQVNAPGPRSYTSNRHCSVVLSQAAPLQHTDYGMVDRDSILDSWSHLTSPLDTFNRLRLDLTPDLRVSSSAVIGCLEDEICRRDLVNPEKRRPLLVSCLSRVYDLVIDRSSATGVHVAQLKREKEQEKKRIDRLLDEADNKHDHMEEQYKQRFRAQQQQFAEDLKLVEAEHLRIRNALERDLDSNTVDHNGQLASAKESRQRAADELRLTFQALTKSEKDRQKALDEMSEMEAELERCKQYADDVTLKIHTMEKEHNDKLEKSRSGDDNDKELLLLKLDEFRTNNNVLTHQIAELTSELDLLSDLHKSSRQGGIKVASTQTEYENTPVRRNSFSTPASTQTQYPASVARDVQTSHVIAHTRSAQTEDREINAFSCQTELYQLTEHHCQTEVNSRNRETQTNVHIANEIDVKLKLEASYSREIDKLRTAFEDERLAMKQRICSLEMDRDRIVTELNDEFEFERLRYEQEPASSHDISTSTTWRVDEEISDHIENNNSMKTEIANLKKNLNISENEIKTLNNVLQTMNTKLQNDFSREQIEEHHEASKEEIKKLGNVLKLRSEETTHLIMESRKSNSRECESLRNKNEIMAEELSRQKVLLEEQEVKITNQYTNQCNAETLTRKLYCENAELIRGMTEIEITRSKIEKDYRRSEKKSEALREVIRKIIPNLINK